MKHTFFESTCIGTIANHILVRPNIHETQEIAVAEGLSTAKAVGAEADAVLLFAFV